MSNLKKKTNLVKQMHGWSQMTEQDKYPLGLNFLWENGVSDYTGAYTTRILGSTARAQLQKQFDFYSNDDRGPKLNISQSNTMIYF